MLESQRGFDIQFINPIPGYCLKTRHWPSVYEALNNELDNSIEEDHMQTNVKVFINVCKSENVDCPELKTTDSKNMYWSLPHCFAPAREELDKKKTRVMVCSKI